ncbi:hypothetical protein N658DRAFT_495881 [Parathielavia hyrcaniae]|uniref:Uncharacterized protein n=1 Tax=Parathielavia hyrcaniae TaxID=113614 RepID=A0AAN6Q1L5_9PEZI|nr:hypothetical protein N658DRAFT_495881 [Parathielavia hyrcaniae]
MEKVAEDPRTGPGRNVNNGGVKMRLTGYCLVRWEWHEFFASKIFHKKTVTQHEVGHLGGLCHWQLKYLKHLWLRVQLPRYDCGQGNDLELAKEHGNSTEWLEGAFEDLFVQLGVLLNPHRIGVSEGVTLEISINSPSDREHHFKQFDSMPSLDHRPQAAPFRFRDRLLFRHYTPMRNQLSMSSKNSERCLDAVQCTSGLTRISPP